MSDVTAMRIARRQHGLLTREQAHQAGLTARQIRNRVEIGRWAVVRPSVYVVAGAPDSRSQSILAACLSTRAVASHATAAGMWGFDVPTVDAVELMTTDGRRPRGAGLSAHRTATLTAHDVTALGPIPLTSPARTLVDCAGRVLPERLGDIVDDAVRRRLVRVPALRVVHERIDTGPGRRSTLAMRAVLDERMAGHEVGDSKAEVDLLRLLRKAPLPTPVLGHRIRVGGRTYKLDFAWPASMLALEFDGWDVHGRFSAFHRDRQRRNRLTMAGWTVVEATAKTDLGDLIDDLVDLLVRRRPATASSDH
jgi:very-short-patch-repair endonuclease